MLRINSKISLFTLIIPILFASCATTPKVNNPKRESSVHFAKSNRCIACQSTIVLPQTINKHRWRSTL